MVHLLLIWSSIVLISHHVSVRFIKLLKVFPVALTLLTGIIFIIHIYRIVILLSNILEHLIIRLWFLTISEDTRFHFKVSIIIAFKLRIINWRVSNTTTHTLLVFIGSISLISPLVHSHQATGILLRLWKSRYLTDSALAFVVGNLTSSWILDIISGSFHFYSLRNLRLLALLWRYKYVCCQVHVASWASLMGIVLIDLLYIFIIKWCWSYLFEGWLIWTVERWFGYVWWRHTRRTWWHISMTISNLREILLSMLKLRRLSDFISVIADKDIITVDCLLHLLIIYHLVKLFSVILIHIMTHFAPFSLRYIISTWLPHWAMVLMVWCMWSLLMWWSTANGRMSMETLILLVHVLLLHLYLGHDIFLLDDHCTFLHWDLIMLWFLVASLTLMKTSISKGWWLCNLVL